jgi:hypothetical protein
MPQQVHRRPRPAPPARRATGITPTGTGSTDHGDTAAPFDTGVGCGGATDAPADSPPAGGCD